MPSIPPERIASPRRHRSRQRERILSWLRGTDCHPTAREIHGALQRELPNLSLGTVYRNLEVLVDEGAIDEVATSVGPTRYDGNVEPHHHFHCEACGRILDVDLPRTRHLERRLSGEHGLHARRVRVDFFGLCTGCAAPAARPSSRGRASRERRP